MNDPILIWIIFSLTIYQNSHTFTPEINIVILQYYPAGYLSSSSGIYK